MGGFVAIISLERLVGEFRKTRVWKLPIVYLFFLIKRYARIFPVMAMVVLFKIYVLAYVSPLNPTNNIAMDAYDEIPQATWRDWSLVFAFDERTNQIYVGWFWYLVIDYQCFMLVPIILMLCWINKKVGILAC